MREATVSVYFLSHCPARCTQCPTESMRKALAPFKKQLEPLVDRILAAVGELNSKMKVTLQIAGYGELISDTPLLAKVLQSAKQYGFSLEIFTGLNDIRDNTLSELNDCGVFLRSDGRELTLNVKWWGDAKTQHRLTGLKPTFTKLDQMEIPVLLAKAMGTPGITAFADCLIQKGNIEQIPGMYAWLFDHKEKVDFKFQLPNACVDAGTAPSYEQVFSNLYPVLSKIHLKKSGSELPMTAPYIGQSCTRIGDIVVAELGQNEGNWVYNFFPCHYWTGSQLGCFPKDSLEQILSSDILARLREVREKTLNSKKTPLLFCPSASQRNGNPEQQGFFFSDGGDWMFRE